MVRSLLPKALLLAQAASLSAFSPSEVTGLRTKKLSQRHSSLEYESTLLRESREIDSEWELPSRSAKKVPVLDSMEITVGRVAMIGAVSLLAREFITGESFWDQVVDSVAPLL